MRGIVLGGALGALLVYFLEPKKGSSRRGGAINTAKSLVQRTGLGGSYAPDNPDPDDNTLRDRIESEVFRNPEYSREHLNIMVVNGIVDLHGQLPTQDEIDALIRRIEGMRNVKGVQSYLHLPGTPAPNKVESLEASS